MPDGVECASRVEEMLREAFARQGSGRPSLEPLGDARVPEPYRSLLVHDSDMTSALQRRHRQELGLDLLHVARRPDSLEREVLLRGSLDGRPVEYGVIRILLAALAPPVAEAVLLGREPLGGLLVRFGIGHRSRPGGYFRMGGDGYLDGLFGDGRPRWRYGRINRLWGDAGDLLAEVVEILPAMGEEEGRRA